MTCRAQALVKHASNIAIGAVVSGIPIAGFVGLIFLTEGRILLVIPAVALGVIFWCVGQAIREATR